MSKFSKYSLTIFISVFMIYVLFGSFSSTIADYYSSYGDLKEHEVLNEDYEIDYQQRGSDISVTAIHGGGIEPGTSEVAEGLANRMNISYYLFKGIKPTNNMILHLTSKNFDEPIGRSLVQDSLTTLSIHGYHDDQEHQPIIYLGGKNEEYRETLQDSFQKWGFQVVNAPYKVGGRNVNNIVNDNQLNAGVQIELTAGLRKSLFENHDWSRANRQNTTEVYERLIDALAEGTNNYREKESAFL
ncbi:poly-gamma-glutamate hydrolase family protein [Oceanobacillus rekensis]|uniref:poly-gamma-glutamate hydrolase family protein n=1 Tax=Oceanobacillus rekensis TaxID=937927 RepID=UPI000B4384C8|nr:poly-gamma-glutamate hydrolase family protein [Oceanobacillus rekensis]